VFIIDSGERSEFHFRYTEDRVTVSDLFIQSPSGTPKTESPSQICLSTLLPVHRRQSHRPRSVYPLSFRCRAHSSGGRSPSYQSQNSSPFLFKCVYPLLAVLRQGFAVFSAPRLRFRVSLNLGNPRPQLFKRTDP
jgi:hypothetical protein